MHVCDFVCVPLFTLIVRALFFMLIPTVGKTYYTGGLEARHNEKGFTIAADLGELLYFYAFCLLGLFWAQHSTSSQRSETYSRIVKPIFFIVLGLGLLAQIICWILLFSINDVCAYLHCISLLSYHVCMVVHSWIKICQ